MFYDHVCDEFRLTNRFSTENAFRMFKESQSKPNLLFDRKLENPLKFSLVK